MTRPCWYIGIALLIGCLIGMWLPTNALIITAIGLLIMVIAMAVPLLRHRRALFLSLVGLCAAFVSLAIVQVGVYLPLTYRVGETVSVTARAREQHGYVYLTVTDGELPKGTRLQLWNYDSTRAPEAYDRVEGTFVLCDHGEQGLSLMQRKAGGIWFALKPKEMAISEGNTPWYAWFDRLREQAVIKINAYLSGDVAALVTGICFGADASLSEQAKSNFRVSGIYHLFSVSGFHMAFLSQAFLWLLTRLRLSRFWRAPLTIAAVLFFMLLVGCEVAVIRSGILCIAVLLGGCFRRQADTRNSLGFALIVLLIGSPFAAYDVGLLLSFFATFGLVVLSPLITRVASGWMGETARENAPLLAKGYDRLVKAVALTLSATVATAPISLVYFGEISLAAVVGNLLTSIPSSALLVCGFLAVLCVGPLLQPLAVVFFFVVGQFSQYLLWISEKISKIPFVTVAITTPYLLLWIMGAAIMVIVGYIFFRRKGVAVAAIAGALALVVSVGTHTVFMRGVATLTVLPTQNDVAFCVQYEDTTVLVCAPTRTNSLRKMKTALQLAGLRHVDVLLVPFGNENTLLTMLSQWGDVLDDAQLWYADETKWMSPYFETAAALPETSALTINGIACRRYGQQLHVSVRQTDVLCCLTDEAVRTLPPELCQSEVVIFGSAVPKDALLLQANVGFLQATSDTVPSPSLYGVERLLTVGQERIRIATRGIGDISY